MMPATSTLLTMMGTLAFLVGHTKIKLGWFVSRARLHRAQTLTEASSPIAEETGEPNLLLRIDFEQLVRQHPTFD